MGFIKCFTMAISSIINNKMRSFLTMLGIIIGITAVIVLVSLMNGLTGEVTDAFQEIGTTSIMVNVQQRATTKQIKPDEMYKFVEENPDLFANVSPTVSMSGTLKIPESGDDSITASCTGISESYAEMKKLNLSFGRFLQYIDCERESKVCVIGTYEALYFFNSASNALNKTIKINGVPYTIVGVLEEKEDSTSSSADDIVYIPYTTAAKQNGSNIIGSYTLDAVNEDVATTATAAAKAFALEKIGDEDYFSVTSMLSMIDKMTEMLGTMSMVLVAIAGISLLVGGIGIMNIMLVSVTERTREIGIRKSLGARQKHIMTQFVIEAGTVSCLGGVIGIILGIILSSLAGKLLDMSVSPSIGAVLLAFSVSVAIGVVFGFLPARKASRLNPIDALRYD